MARLQCKCGTRMSTTDWPSSNTIYVYFEEEIGNAISYNSGILLKDFMDEWDEITSSPKTYMTRSVPVEYWYCTECGRVSVVENIPAGKVLRSFIPNEQEEIFHDIAGWIQLYAFSEISYDRVTEEDENITLIDYITSNDVKKIFLSPDLTKVAVVQEKDYSVIYGLE